MVVVEEDVLKEGIARWQFALVWVRLLRDACLTLYRDVGKLNTRLERSASGYYYGG